MTTQTIIRVLDDNGEDFGLEYRWNGQRAISIYHHGQEIEAYTLNTDRTSYRAFVESVDDSLRVFPGRRSLP